MYKLLLNIILLIPWGLLGGTNSAANSEANSEPTSVRQLSAPVFPAEWTNRLVIAGNEALGDFGMAWDDRGTRLLLSDAEGGRALECTLRRRRSTCVGTPTNIFDQTFHDGLRVTAMMPNTNDTATLSVRRSRQRCTIYVDGQPCLSFTDRWDGLLTVSTSAADHEDSLEEGFVQRLGRFTFADNFLVDKEAPEALQNWEIRSGTWGLHAVTGTTVSATVTRELKRFPKPERSPNFYSLNGQGSNAMILTGESFHNQYVLRAAVQHNSGTNGLVFLAHEKRGAHAFTVQTDEASGRLIFALWRGGFPATGPGRFVECVLSDRVPGDWLMLEIRIFEDRVACLVDNVEVMRRRLAFPPGGLFGLYCNTADGTRFDDVAAMSHDEMPIDCRDDLAPWLRPGTAGNLEQREGPLEGLPANGVPFATAAHLAKPGATEPATMILGATNMPPGRIDLALAPLSESWSAGLLAGWQGQALPYFKMIAGQARRGGETEVQLLRIVPGGTNRTLDQVVLPPDAGTCLTLALDATAPDGLYGYVNGRAVVWSPAGKDSAADGATGVTLDTATQANLTLPLARREVPRLADRFEKNNIYVTDPYMRHWASPEGQWLEYPGKLAWYKSDVLRQVEVSMPYVNGATLHMLLPEGVTNGTLQVAMTNDAVILSAQGAGGTNLQEIARAASALFPESQPLADGPKVRFCTVRLQDFIFTLNSDTGLVARLRVPQPLAGRRMMMQGMETANLAFTRVIREPVLDCLFTESLHDWNISGGKWEVINRFQCYPDWSHMNGESADSLASLWSKYEITGDFSVEYFAGMRHGWYQRLGDLNLTILNHHNTPGSGYTVTAGGWDPDHSQLWTTLWRNGEKLAQSDQYTVPRVRAGNQRRGYEPLVATGRDVHGAWYTLRLRRVGDRLTFDFDNERILDVRDPEPLQTGSFGIWTYRNSMMVARVRVTADSIRPRAFGFTPMRHLPAASFHSDTTSISNAFATTINGWPAQMLLRELWHADEDDNSTRIFFRNTHQAPEMHVVNAQGGGDFLALVNLPDIAADKLIGWRFEVARHPGARFNFEYAVGRIVEGAFTVVEELSYGICGTPEERGPRRLAGRLARPPAPTTAKDSDLVWTPCVAWLPIEGVAQGLMVRMAGFGNLQPSTIQQGIEGNPPGAWYAIRNLRPIFRGVPVVATTGGQDLKPLQEQIGGADAGKLNRLTLPPELVPGQNVIEWGVMPGGDLALVAQPSRRPSHSLRVSSTLPWPNALLTAANVRVNDRPVPATWIEDNELVVPLPRGLSTNDAPMRLALDLADGRAFTQILPGAALLETEAGQPSPAAPILMGLDLTNNPACLQNFESREIQPAAFQIAQPPTLRFDDPVQGCHILFSNNGHAERLQGLLASGYDLARWPLLQFRYRGDRMAQVSIHALNSGVINFAEEESRASRVPLAPEARLNQKWHTWIGRVAAFTLSRPVNAGFTLAPTDLRIGSLGRHDQTGLYSTLAVDDLAAGPAIGPSQTLAFRARYDAPRGLETCAYGIASGTMPWTLRAAADQEAIEWRDISTNIWIGVDTGTLHDGIHHLVLRAKAPGGEWSPVTDLPFLLDRTPVVISSAIVQTNRLNGTLLAVTFDPEDGAPPLMETLRIVCDGQPFDFASDPTGTVHYRTNGISLEMNYPLILRQRINQARNGTSFNLRIGELTDAAGNISPPHQTSIRIDYAADKTPPDYLPLSTPTNALWWAPVIGQPNDLFNFNRNLTVTTGRSKDYFPFVGLANPGDKAAMVGHRFKDPFWVPSRHRHLALSLRLAPDTKLTNNTAFFSLRFRLDKIPKGAKPHNGGAYLLEFNPKTAADNNVLFGNLKWEPGRWNDLTVDVTALLQRESGIRDFAFDLQEFAIELPPLSPYKIEVRAGAIMAPWAAAEMYAFRAYDASGIAGLYWQGNGHAPHTVFRPAMVKLPPDDPCWMKVTIRDRAGNSTPVHLLPTPPHPPVSSSLPLSEDWK